MTTWGKVLGLALLASWQRAQTTAVSSLARLHGGGIVGVFGLGSVAGFAGDDDVLALLFLIDHVGMAGLADIVAGVGDRAGGDFGDGGAAIVSVLAETVGDDEGTQADEGNQGDGHDDREPDEVFDVLEQDDLSAPDSGRGCAQNCAMLLDT